MYYDITFSEDHYLYSVIVLAFMIHDFIVYVILAVQHGFTHHAVCMTTIKIAAVPSGGEFENLGNAKIFPMF